MFDCMICRMKVKKKQTFSAHFPRDTPVLIYQIQKFTQKKLHNAVQCLPSDHFAVLSKHPVD